MKRKIFILIFSIITFGVIIKADEIQKGILKDYTGRYTFIDVENSTTENVSVELLSDSTLKVVATAGTVTLKLLKDDEFKVSEYEGQVIFIRDETKLKVIGVKVIVPIANIEAEGKKVQIEEIKEIDEAE